MPRVLIVEDEPDCRRSLCMLLATADHDVRVAADGPSGLQLALAWRPDAVVCDIGLPGMDGWELGRLLRAALGPGVLLVAVSGYCMEVDLARSLAAGFDRHLAKPADPEVLLRLLADTGAGSG